MPSAVPPGSPAATPATPRNGGRTARPDHDGGVGVVEPDDTWLEQLVGLRSAKAGYYARWRGTHRDLERALAALRALSEVFCVTGLGSAALCEDVLAAVGRLVDAKWASLVLIDAEMLSTAPPYVQWCARGEGAGAAPTASQAALLSAQLTGTSATLLDSADASDAIVGVPMRLDFRPVGALLIGLDTHTACDAIRARILETVANQIVVALRNAWLFEHSEDLRGRAVDGWAEAERRAAELARRNDQLRHARGQLAQARQAQLVAAERQRIARELHDGVAQCLVGIGMHMEWCRRHQLPGSVMNNRLLASKELARSALQGIRDTVVELSELDRPAAGLAQALRDLGANFRSIGPLRVSVRVCGRAHPLPLEVEHSLFQICQEALWNVVRHAHASQAWLELRYLEGQARLSITDDGVGEPVAMRRLLAQPPRARGRHGLRNIADRAGELGGQVTVARRRGGGVRIRVQVPQLGAAAEPCDEASAVAAALRAAVSA